jgi:hypothetical protein
LKILSCSKISSLLVSKINSQINLLAQQQIERDAKIAAKEAAKPAPPRMWPYPGAKPILSRPHLTISGKRHVPRFTSTSIVPFLCIRKPQPSFLSKIIRDKHKKKQIRLDRIQQLSVDLEYAQAEDRWESHLREFSEPNEKLDKLEPSYTTAIKQSLAVTYDAMTEASEHQQEMAKKLWDIVKQEQMLADKEKAEKKQAKWERWLARKAKGESSDN